MRSVLTFSRSEAALNLRRRRCLVPVNAGLKLAQAAFRQELADRIVKERRIAQIRTAIRKRAALCFNQSVCFLNRPIAPAR